MVNGPIEAALAPLVALIVMGGLSPTSLTVGMPRKVPVAGLKLAHAGRPSMAKVMRPLPCKSVG